MTTASIMRDREAAAWLTIVHGEAPLILSLPHTGTRVPESMEPALASSWLARKDTDWWLDVLYDFAFDLGATIVRTDISRTVVDVNRDPSGASLYPGQATTELCPTTTFDGEPLWQPGQAPGDAEAASRCVRYFAPYHAALAAAIERAQAAHGAVILYDCHSIRSVVPRLFEGVLPHLNIGTHGGRSANRHLTRKIEAVCEASAFAHVTNGRFKGGYITRHYGQPLECVHAVQMEIACRCYLREPEGPLHQDNWPPPYGPARARPLRAVLRAVLAACLADVPRLVRQGASDDTR